DRGGRHGRPALEAALRRLPRADRQRTRGRRGRSCAPTVLDVPPPCACPALRRGGRRGPRLVTRPLPHLPQLRLGAAPEGGYAATVAGRRAAGGGRTQRGR